jgi:hypothetical protein
VPKTIRIRVPDDLYRKLYERAASQGLTPSEYLLRLAEAERPSEGLDVHRPTIEELTERIRSRGRVEGVSAAEIVRELRGEIG